MFALQSNVYNLKEYILRDLDGSQLVVLSSYTVVGRHSVYQQEQPVVLCCGMGTPLLTIAKCCRAQC